MKRYHFLLTVVFMTVAAIALSAPHKTLASTTTTLKPPLSVTHKLNYGLTVGDIGSLEWLDQSGTMDTPANYVGLQTPGSRPYSAYFTFSLPISTFRNNIQTVQIQANYFGQKKKQQLWTWSIYNWRTKKWVRVGTSASVASAATWTFLAFNAPGKTPIDYVDKATRQMKIQVKSSNGKYDARLDYLALALTVADDAAPTLGGCPVFPADNIWNARVDKLPVAANSSRFIASIGKRTGLHPDFDAIGDGIPFNTATNTTPVINFLENMFWYGDESDTGNYPIPIGFLQEGGGDAHILTVNTDTCFLYELYAATINGASSEAGSGAIWSLNSNAMRQDGWTSADAAGLPILPGLVRYDEVASGRINHALRFTASKIRDTYIWPASHHARCGGISATNKKVAPMGQRFRLKASYVIPDTFSPQTKVVLTALKEYGMILADCGSNWYISGEPSDNWIDDALVPQLRSVPGSAFEAVDVSSLRTANPNSYAIAP